MKNISVNKGLLEYNSINSMLVLHFVTKFFTVRGC